MKIHAIKIISAGVLFVSILTSCGTPSSESASALNQTLLSYQNGNLTKLAASTDTSDLFMYTTDSRKINLDNTIKEQLRRSFEFKIIDTEEEKDRAKASVEIKNYDLSRIYRNYFNIMTDNPESSADKRNEAFLSLLQSTTPPVKTYKISVEIQKSNGKWKPIISNSLKNALLANIPASSKMLLKEEKLFALHPQLDSDTSDKLLASYDFIEKHIWSQGFLTVVNHYANPNSELNIKKVVSKLNKSIDQLSKYDAFYNSLNEKKYPNLKYFWSMYKKELFVVQKEMNKRFNSENKQSLMYLDIDLYKYYHSLIHQIIDHAGLHGEEHTTEVQTSTSHENH